MPSHTRYPDDTDETPAVTGSDPRPDRPAAAGATDDPPPKKTLPINLSLSQVIGGSLAAATAAALGSKLGVAGTIGGAALASVVSAVAGSVYTASVQRTRQGVQSAFSRRVPKPTATDPTRVSLSEEAIGLQSRRDAEETALTLDPGAAGSSVPSTAPTTPVSTVGPTGSGRPTVRVARPRRSGVRWRSVLVGAVAVFVLTSLGIFGFETLTGRALDGDRGTTISQVVHGSSGTSGRTESGRSEPSTSTSGSASTSASADPTPSSEPSSSASAEPSSRPSTSSEPSGSATASSSPSASAGTTPSGSTSAEAGSGIGTGSGTGGN